MKKVLLLSLVMSISFWGFSQQRTQVNSSLKNISKKAVHVTPTDEVVVMPVDLNSYVSTPKELVNQDQIGTTFYDLQTNAMIGNRIHVYPDGTMGAVWTRGMDAPGFANRGSGYNFFDGTSWGPEPTARVEDARTGWPSYAPLGENGEIIIAHLVAGLKVSTREQKGVGEWSFNDLIGPTDLTWPRMITTGEDNNSVHMIVNSYDPYEGQPRALFYYRSLDGAESWDIEEEIIEGLGADYYTEINADDYVWAEARGGALAFLVGGAWMDLLMMKSTDNGDSWEKTVIWEHPYPFFDWEATIADTFYCVDNSANITLDADGMAHVVFGISRVMHLELGTTYNYFPYTDGIGYWNETMPTFSNNHHALSPYSDDPESELVENVSLIGWTQDVDGSGEIEFLEELMSYRELGISTMPTIAVDDYGTVMVAFSSTTEGYDNTIYNYKHVWVRSQQAGGAWGEFEDINVDVAHMFDECVYPLIGQYIDPVTQTAHVMYQADFDPGFALDDEHPYVENRMIVANFNLIMGLEENEANMATFTVSQNVPNPAVNNTTITVATETTGSINLSVSNLLGQVVHQENIVTSSHAHTFEVNVSNYDSGIYFYTIEIGNSSVTKKMLVR